ncbi:hypothetical protein [Serratia liquefaciens]|uniref:hypothetical protein n=1 Tax=Serratia liquefaciens TaxID=614 RepID=UPI0005C9BE23|nr:hypothetical protein [Serratia liquefaciens]GAK26238.1 hypothetical protein SLIQ_06165 [Serratia liquefaciens FK01]
MAKTNAERKAAQRERQRLAGIVPVEIKLDQQEAEMLRENCAARRPQREPYDLDEYISMLIRKDNAELKKQLAARNKRCCGKCKDKLPGDPEGCYFLGDSECWQTYGWHETKLTVCDMSRLN